MMTLGIGVTRTIKCGFVTPIQIQSLLSKDDVWACAKRGGGWINISRCCEVRIRRHRAALARRRRCWDKWIVLMKMMQAILTYCSLLQVPSLGLPEV
jgi:hypothetical protein